MKKLLFVFALSVLLLPFVPQAKSQDVSVDFFYNNLNGGSWVEVGNYGYCWQPDVAVSDASWRPYADGYWAYTDEGWTWVSYEDFGWATYHYGRWVRLADYGWVWRPGYEWGPAWVSWRFGGGYAGWAPLPPETEVVYESRPLTGHLDVEFDIGPAYYNFVDVRYIGEPVLRSRIVDVNQNVTYINQTVNVTNITYKNKTVYNYGPDLNTVNQYSSRPIQKLKLERQANVDVTAAAKSGGLMKVQGNALMVAAPTTIKKSATQIAPPTVKTKVGQPKVEHGWAGVPNEAQLKEQIKTENPKNIPPPTGAAATGQATGGVSPAGTAATTPTSPAPGRAPVVAASPAISASPTTPAVSATPFERGKGKGRGRPGATPPVGAVASPTAAAAPATSPAPLERGRGRSRTGGKPQPGLTGTPAGSPTGAASPTFQGSPAGTERGKPGKGRQRGEIGPTPPGQPGVAPETTQSPGRGKGQFERGVSTPTPGQPGGAANIPEQGKHRGRGPEQTGTPSATGAAPYETRGGKERGQG